MFNELNHTGNSVVPESVKDLNSLPFVNLKDYIGKEIKVEGYFFTEGKFGQQVSIISKGKKINMPKRAVEDFLKIANNEEMKRAVKAGKLLLVDIKEIDTNNGKTTAWKFKDAE